MNPFLVAWRASKFLPRSVIRGICAAFAWIVWLRRAKPVRRLESNLGVVTGLQGRELRALSRRGMASTARYYAEVLEASRVTPQQLDNRLRLEGFETVEGILANGKSTVAVLGHLGNWDLVGAYAARHIIPIVAVAEVLKPQEVFDEFVAMRADLGIRVLGHEGGATFRELIRVATSERALVCLIADRDLSGSGIPVQMWGATAKVAPGPAALSQAAKVPLIPVLVRYERLRGRKARLARSRWGIVMSFGNPLDPADFTGPDRVAAMSQAWATQFAAHVASYPQDWHMLQRFGWVEA